MNDMQFTDFAFLFGFLPAVFLLYWLYFQKHAANLFLVIVSLLFYGWGSVHSLLILILILCWNYAACRMIGLLQDAENQSERKKTLSRFSAGQILIIAIAGDLLILSVYRYLPGFLSLSGSASLQKRAAGIFTMPIGLSFYLFSCISALADIYMQKEKVCSMKDFALFAAFFGWVNMGPIAHYRNLAPQLDHHPMTRKNLKKGAALFIQGLSFKVILSNNLGLVFSGLSANTTWLGTLLLNFSYFLMIYFDFAGYSRMARGLGAFFGFDIPKNFDEPYLALSVQDFWRRWHISLTSWFRDYVYIPLGGNRVRRRRWILNVMAVWLLTGIWHGFGLSFVIWGLLQGALILLEKLVLSDRMKHWPRALLHSWVVFWELIGWTLFSSASLTTGLERIVRMSGILSTGFCDGPALFYLKNAAFLLFVCVLIISRMDLILISIVRRSVSGPSVQKFDQRWRTLVNTAYIFSFAICLIFEISSTAQTFLYAVF